MSTNNFWGGYFIGRTDARAAQQMHEVAQGLAQRIFGGRPANTIAEMEAELDRLRNLVMEACEAGMAVEEGNKALRREILAMNATLRSYRFLARK